MYILHQNRNFGFFIVKAKHGRNNTVWNLTAKIIEVLSPLTAKDVLLRSGRV